MPTLFYERKATSKRPWHARPPRAAGVSSPRHALKGIPQEPGRALVFSRQRGDGTPDPKGPGPGARRDAPHRGANKHLAEEIPDAEETEAAGKDGERSYAPHSTDEGGKPVNAGSHRREGGDKRTYRQRGTWRYTETENHVHGTASDI